MIFDTHTHYNDEVFDGDREEVLKRIQAEGVGRVVDIGASMESTEAAVKLSEVYDFIYATAGVHPSDIDRLAEDDMERLKEIAGKEKVVAIGEIGLDYHYENIDKELQKRWFVRQLELAREVGLPVCIHSRDAAKDTLDIMQAAHSEEIGGVIHCFSYGWDMAKIYLNMGFYLGIGGVLTFKNARKLKEVVEKAPLERLVLETDAPYLAPEPYRGKRNASYYLKYVVDEIAAIKGITSKEVMQATWDNAVCLYRMGQ